MTHPHPHRCAQLGIACIEQVRSQGRPPKARLSEPVRPESSSTASAGCAAEACGGAPEGASRKRPWGGGGKEGGKYPVLVVASVLSNGFAALQSAGHVRYDKATSVL
jgi:hypothetical protein